MVIDVTGYQDIQESTSPEVKALMSKWRLSNEKRFGKQRERFESHSVTDKEYIKFKEIFNTLRTEEDYKEYKKAFDYLCKYCHIVPNGTIISKYQLEKGKEDDMNHILVEYTVNTKAIDLPDNIALYHNSPVDGIKALLPKFRLRGRNENGYLCDKPRVYLTIKERLSPFHTDNDIIRKFSPNAGSKFGSKMHLYEVKKNPSKCFVDPMVPDTNSKCMYIETEEPIEVRQIK